MEYINPVKQANEKAANITQILNDKINRANEDPRLWVGREEGRDWYRPIRRQPPVCEKEHDVWSFYDRRDVLHLGQLTYWWSANYELGKSKSSTGFMIKYWPYPLEVLDRLREERRDSKEKEDYWRKANPKIDLSKELFEVSGDILTNDFDDILNWVDDLIEEIAQSRIDASHK